MSSLILILKCGQNSRIPRSQLPVPDLGLILELVRLLMMDQEEGGLRSIR